MVVLSLGQYAALTEDAEMRLDEGIKRQKQMKRDVAPAKYSAGSGSA